MNFVLQYAHRGALNSLYASSSVAGNHLVLYYPSEVGFASTDNPVFFVSLHLVELDQAITSEVVLCYCGYPILKVLLHLVHLYLRIG